VQYSGEGNGRRFRFFHFLVQVPPFSDLIPETEPEKKGRVQHFLDCAEAEILYNCGDQIPTRNLVGINSCEE
jgi:hypothetical protein